MYVEWHDDPLPKFYSDLIGHLRDEVWRLRGEGSMAQTEDVTAIVDMSEDQTARKMMVMSLQGQLKEKNAEFFFF